MGFFADSLNRIQPSATIAVSMKARQLKAQGRDIISLSAGEPDFDTPQNIKDAAKKALDQGWTHYGPTQGLPELRKSLADYVSRTRGIQVGPEHVCVAPGGMPLLRILLVLSATIGPP